MSAAPAVSAAIQPGLTLDEPAGRRLLATTVLGSAMVFLDGTITNVALPRIGRELGADLAGLQWVVNGYALALAALILVGGSLGDRYGRRRVYGIGVAAFVVASVLVALAPTIGTLVAARVVQGVAAALLTPGSLAMLQASFAPQDRMRAIGAWSGTLGIATAAGPVVGGWLVGIDWRLGFWVNLPLGILVLALLRGTPESRDDASTGRFDLPAVALGPMALGGITWALTDPSSPGALPAAVVGVVAAAAFVAWERRTRYPMVPPAMFANRVFTSINLVTLLVYAALPGQSFFLALALQVSAGWSPLAAGAAMLPTSLLMLALSGRFGAIATRRGPRPVMVGGIVLLTAGLLVLAAAPARPGYLVHVLPGVLLVGFGLSMLVSPLTGTVLAAAPAGKEGIASGINNAVSRTAGLLAIAALPLVVGLSGQAYRDGAAVHHAYRLAMLTCAGLTALGGVLAWVGLAAPHPPHEDDAERR